MLENFSMCKVLMEALTNETAFCEEKFYTEYFDNRLYLLEIYLDNLARVLFD